MSIARKMALAVLSPLFITLLFVTAFDIGFVRTATHPETVKKLVAESGIYNSVVPSLLQQTKSINTSVGTINVRDPAIETAANSAISPKYIQQNTEAAIDSVYKWLDGNTAQPDFQIDLTAAKNNFADNVAASLQQRLAGLPACTAAQTAAIAQSGQFNAISTTCLPRGVTAAQAANQVKASLSGSGDFLDKTTVSADTIKNGDSNQSIFQSQLKTVPKRYQLAKKTPLVLSILTILCGVGIVFLSPTWQKGLRHVGINLVVIGLIMLVFSYALNRAVSTIVVPKIKLNNAILQTDIHNLANDITRQIDKNYWFFGGLYTVLGAGSLAATEVLKRKNPPETDPAPAPTESKQPEPAKLAKKSD